MTLGKRIALVREERSLISDVDRVSQFTLP
jgi:hypothetical protein